MKNEAVFNSMTAINFDTLKFAQRAQQAGFTKEQAEFQAEELASIIETKLATKNDLLLLEKHITIKMGLMLVALGSVLVACLKMLLEH